MLSIELSKSSRTAQRAAGVFADVRTYLSEFALTEREIQVVLLVLRGMTNKEIARSFKITEQTVKDHLKHVYGKVGVHQRTALCAKVLRLAAEPIPA